MTTPISTPGTIRRRDALRRVANLATWAACGAAPISWAQSATGAATAPGNAQLPPPTAWADQWRAVSRLGYGFSPAVQQDIQAASNPRTWALQQIDLAYRASRNAPAMASDVQDILSSMPDIAAGMQHERQARRAIKILRESAAQVGTNPKNAAANAAGADQQQASGRFDFSTPAQPEHFSSRMAAKAAAWRLQACSQPEQENLLLARMTEFWFNHLNVFVNKAAVRPYIGRYVIDVARAHALGRFEDLLLASAHHPAMLHYLDQAQSVADGSRGKQGATRGLNENYARELMELHTLGVDGGYTQTDVHELARVLTGWTVDPGAADGFRFAMRVHDSGSKQVLGHRYPDSPFNMGQTEGEQAIRMLAHHPSTAHRLSLRLAQFFVADQPSAALVAHLSKVFLKSQGDIKVWLQALVQSPDFWDPANRLFKTPMDFACSALTAVQTAQDRRSLVLTMGFLAGAGQPLHGWQTPDGYKTDAATWMAPEALTRRADYAMALGRLNADLNYLLPYLGDATRRTLAQQNPGLRSGLLLSSPEFMYK